MTKTRLPLAQAEDIAHEVVALLGHVCHRIEIAGSIRRRKPDVGDVEIVCVPKVESAGEDLFGESIGAMNLQLEAVHRLLADGTFYDRLDKNGHRACGERMQRLLFMDFPLDIFCVLPPAQWGVIFAIRTGSANFSHRFMTPKPHGNMPFGMRVENGQLLDRGVVVPTPEEADFFAAIGMDYVKPEDRT